MTQMKMNRFSPATLAVGVLAGCGLAVALFAASFTQASAVLDEHDNEKVGVATYEPQLAFQQYYGMQEFNVQMQRMQQEMQEAQQQGDQQRLMQLQQEMQQLQTRTVEKFYEDVEKVIPEVAEKAGVELIAIEIVYAGEQFREPKDITDELIRKVNEEAGEDTESEPQPDLPW
jgi:uncharacterized membrane protein YhiD involved in acid resistance